MGSVFAERSALTSTRFFPKRSVPTLRSLASVFLVRGHPSVEIQEAIIPLVPRLRGALAPGGGARAEERAPLQLRLRLLMPPQVVVRFDRQMARSSGHVSLGALTLKGTVNVRRVTIARLNIFRSTESVPKLEISAKRALLDPR